MCKCKSYNWKVKGAKHPNVIVDVPKNLRDGKNVCALISVWLSLS